MSTAGQVLFVESGFGCDQHGQNATVGPVLRERSYAKLAITALTKLCIAQKAVVRACRNAIEFNSIPSVERLVPGGRNGLKLKIKIGTPFPVRDILLEEEHEGFFRIYTWSTCP